MALEDQITKMTAALDANTAAMKVVATALAAAGGGTPAAAGGAIKPAGTVAATKKAPAIEFDQVKVAGAKVVEKHGKPFAKKMIQDVGGAKELAAVKTEKYPALFKAFEAALAEGVDEPEAEVEDDEL